MRLPSGRIRSLSLLTIMLLAALAANATAWEKSEISKSFEVSPGGQLYLDTDLGTVEVETADVDAVEVNILLKADTRDEEKAQAWFDRFEADFEQDGDDVYITGDFSRPDKGWRFWEGDNVKLRVVFYITVPKEFNVTIETNAGSVTVADLTGDVKAKTSGGSLEFDHIEGTVNGKTSGGSIELTSCIGSADVKTSGGSISIGRVEGDIVAHTSGGSINVDEVMGAIDASTSGGSVSARITRQPKDDCRLVTSGGSVNVYLDPEMNFDLDARTSAGRVSTDFPVKVSGKLSKSSLRAEINEGGPELYLRTSGGNINLYEL